MTSSVQLIRDGWLPKELPAAFTAEKFADHYAIGPIDTAGPPTRAVGHSLARANGFRRELSIPNPRSFAALADSVELHWQEIDAHLNRSPFSLSRPSPSIVAPVERAMSLAIREQSRPSRRAADRRGRRFVLRTDVSRWYPSLYTHSIPWALHTRAVAKRRRRDRSLAGNAIDSGLQQCADGQTSGIAIGPDTSLVAAEIVLTAVDLEIARAQPGIKGHRFYDDYELAFASRGEAEAALGHLEVAAANYELRLNEAKTVVEELPQPFDASWIDELRRMPLRKTRANSLADGIALFSRAADLSVVDGAPMAYAVKKSQNWLLRTQDWPVFQDLIWSAASSEPVCLRYALRTLSAVSAQRSLPIDDEVASEVLDQVIRTHAPLANTSEVAWALWAAIEISCELSRESAALISVMKDDFVALLALHAEEQGRFQGSLDHKGWISLISDDDALVDEHWLLAYEGCASRLLPDAEPIVSGDAFFGELLAEGVRFFEPDDSDVDDDEDDDEDEYFG